MSALPFPEVCSLATACDAVFTMSAPSMVGLVRPGPGWAAVDGPSFEAPEDLIGFEAPQHWSAVAVVVAGHTRDLDRPDRPPVRARITFALDRRGRSASTITTADSVLRLSDDDGQARGHLADICHRVLGLPAAPEETDPTPLANELWLTEVLEAHQVFGPCFPLDDWSGVLSLHPFGPSALRAVDGWRRLHRFALDVLDGWRGFDRSDVAWMDAPTFARYALEHQPQVDVLLRRLARSASPAVMAKVHSFVTGSLQAAQ